MFMTIIKTFDRECSKRDLSFCTGYSKDRDTRFCSNKQLFRKELMLSSIHRRFISQTNSSSNSEKTEPSPILFSTRNNLEVQFMPSSKLKATYREAVIIFSLKRFRDFPEVPSLTFTWARLLPALGVAGPVTSEQHHRSSTPDSGTSATMFFIPFYPNSPLSFPFPPRQAF